MINAEGGSAQIFRYPLGDFRHPLKITLPPPGRNPENAPDRGRPPARKLRQKIMFFFLKHRELAYNFKLFKKHYLFNKLPQKLGKRVRGFRISP